VAWRAFALSRLFVWAVGIAAVLVFGLDERQSVVYDPSGLTRPGGALAELLAAPAARWDSMWFLTIAEGGYDEARAAFFPLYPGLLWLTGGSVLGGVLVSAAATVAGLVVLHRLVALDHGPRAAALTVALVAWFPMAGFLSAVYSEGLFLALSVGAVYTARTGRWGWAGALGGLAAATRSAGLVLLVPLAVLWWTRSDRSPRDLALLALVPGAQAAFCAGLWAAGMDPWAPFAAQEEFWSRTFAGPLAAVPDAVAAAWRGAPHVLAGGIAGEVARFDVLLLGALAFALVAVVGALRRLEPAYGLYAAAALVLPLSYPVPAQPLMSLPRFLLVLWPLQLWLALWLLDRRRPAWAPRAALAVSAVLLGVSVALFSTWHWVA